jgi:carboxyl-terminal processing protease
MNRILVVASLLSAFACGQSDAHETTASSQTTATSATPGAPPTPATPATPDADDDDVAPRAPFGDGARAFATVRETLLKNYYAEGLTEDDLYRAATAGMLERADPTMKKWNKLLGPDEIAELRNDLKGEVVGIGVHISFDSASGYADVIAALAGSPSEKAGLLAGDKIVTVNGKLYKGKHLREVVADIRGKAGEPVTLTVLRADKLVTFTVTRERVAYDQTRHFVLPDGVGYVRVPSFTEKSPAEVKAALEALARSNVRALVVDLRQNRGGSFEHAVDTADLFLAKGTGIVSLKKKGKDPQNYVAKTGGVLTNVPLAVLAGDGTGSSAELMAAALQEGRHARVVGKKTMGKWSVQSLEELPNGYAYKYTVSLFHSPNGRNLEGKGLSPDVEVDMSENDLSRANAAVKPEERLANDVQLRTAKELLVR